MICSLKKLESEDFWTQAFFLWSKSYAPFRTSCSSFDD